MMVGSNKQQAAVDAALKAAKDRRRVIALATRAAIAPESLSLQEIKIVSDFVLDYVARPEDSETN